MIYDVDTGLNRYYGIQVIGNTSYIELHSIDGKILDKIYDVKIEFDLYKIIVKGEVNTAVSGLPPNYESKVWVLTKSSK